MHFVSFNNNFCAIINIFHNNTELSWVLFVIRLIQPHTKKWEGIIRLLFVLCACKTLSEQQISKNTTTWFEYVCHLQWWIYMFAASKLLNLCRPFWLLQFNTYIPNNFYVLKQFHIFILQRFACRVLKSNRVKLYVFWGNCVSVTVIALITRIYNYLCQQALISELGSWALLLDSTRQINSYLSAHVQFQKSWCFSSVSNWNTFRHYRTIGDMVMSYWDRLKPHSV